MTPIELREFASLWVESDRPGFAAFVERGEIIDPFLLEIREVMSDVASSDQGTQAIAAEIRRLHQLQRYVESQEVSGLFEETTSHQCPNCHSQDTRRATAFWQCLTCGHEWAEVEPEALREGPTLAFGDHAGSAPNPEAPESATSGEKPRKHPFGRIRLIIDLDGNTQTIAHSGLIYLDHVLSGKPKSLLDLAASVSDAIDEVIEATQQTVKLFGCQGILERIEAETPRGETP